MPQHGRPQERHDDLRRKPQQISVVWGRLLLHEPTLNSRLRPRPLPACDLGCRGDANVTATLQIVSKLNQLYFLNVNVATTP